MATIGPFGWVGGYNNAALTYELGKDQLCDGQDAQVIYGTLQKRGGSAYINSSALNSGAQVTGLYDWLSTSGTRYQLIVCGNAIYKTTSLGDTPSAITGSATITAGNLHTFASLNNIVGIFGGTDTPLQWTGSGNVGSLAGSPPTGNIAVTANYFMFIAGNATYPSRVYWSNAADPGTWTSSNYIDFRPGDGDTVTALADFNQNLIIFKRRSLGILYTQSNTIAGAVTLAPLTQIPCYVGAAGPLCWDHMPDGSIVYLGSNGHVYLFNGATPTDISDQAYPYTNIQPLFDAVSIAQLPNACVQVYPIKHQIWISVAINASTTNNVIYVYDYLNECWQPPFTNINASVMEAVVDTRSTPSHSVVMCTGNYAGYMVEQDKGTTNIEASGGNIDGYGSVCVVLGPDQTDFEPKSIIVPYEGQSVATLTNINYGINGYRTTGNTFQVQMQQAGGQLDSTFIMDTSTLAGDALQRQVIPLQNPGRVYSITVQIRNQNASQPFTVHPIYVSEEVAT